MNENRPRQFTTNPTIKPPSIQHIQQNFMTRQNYQPQQHLQRNPMIQKINNQIRHIDQINRELLTIAERIRATKGKTSPPTSIPVIDKIQSDLHESLQQLIQNIMQFFTDIDVKLKNVGVIVNNQLINKNSHTNDHHSKPEDKNNNDSKYQILAERIKGLQLSLRETQQNEKKLVTVIQNLMERYQVNDQPTLIRESPTLQNQFKRNRITTNSSTNIHNRNTSSEVKNLKEPLPIKQNDFFKQQNRNKSIYENLYTIQESVVDEQHSPLNLNQQPLQFKLRQIQKQDPSDQVYIKKLYSNTPYPQLNFDQKKSLRNDLTSSSTLNRSLNKQERSTATQSSYQDDKQHRFNFMIGKLNN